MPHEIHAERQFQKPEEEIHQHFWVHGDYRQTISGKYRSFIQRAEKGVAWLFRHLRRSNRRRKETEKRLGCRKTTVDKPNIANRVAIWRPFYNEVKDG
jgi:hypothetical protein